MRLTGPIGLGVRALLSAAITGLALLASVYTVAVFAAAGIVAVVMQVGPLEFTESRVLWALGAGGVLALPSFGLVVAAAIRRERRQLLEGTVPLEGVDAEVADEIDATGTRLATQFDVATPQVRLHSSDTAFAYTTYGPADPIVAIRRRGSPSIVLSKGLVRALPADEREAVLAHEFAHLSNDDLQLTSWLLVPLFAAEFLHDPGEKPWDGDPLGWLLASAALVGVGVFSRGRELAADRAAAAATGDPGALAAALERLDDRRPRRPDRDLRVHARSTNAITVLPTLADDETTRRGLRATHPPLEVRLAELRSAAADE